jgi:hypothetical protein
MQLLTAKELTTLKTTAQSMYSALEIVEDVFCSTLDTTLVALTSKRAIAGYKAVYSVIMIILLCCQYVYIWLRHEFADPTTKPPIIGELVIPAPIPDQEPESIPDPWVEPDMITLLVPEISIDFLSEKDEVQPAIAGLLPPASPVKTPRKRTKKAEGTTTAKKSTRKRKEVVATV